MLDDAAGDMWLYRGDPSVGAPLDRAGAHTGEVPFPRPEIVLLFKSQAPSETDQTDFTAVLPHLEPEAKAWLTSALAPGHPWLSRLT